MILTSLTIRQSQSFCRSQNLVKIWLQLRKNTTVHTNKTLYIQFQRVHGFPEVHSCTSTNPWIPGLDPCSRCYDGFFLYNTYVYWDGLFHFKAYIFFSEDGKIYIIKSYLLRGKHCLYSSTLETSIISYNVSITYPVMEMLAKCLITLNYSKKMGDLLRILFSMVI